jgi:hypothetical protein
MAKKELSSERQEVIAYLALCQLHDLDLIEPTPLRVARLHLREQLTQCRELPPPPGAQGPRAALRAVS